MMLGNAPRSCASVKATVAVLVSGVGSPVWMVRVSVKLKEAPAGMLATVAELLLVKAWIASASRFANKESVNELFGSLVSRTRLGICPVTGLVLVLVTV